MKATREYERVEMDYGGLLEGCLKRVVSLKYVLAVALCFVLWRAFLKLADALLAAPVETLIGFAVVLAVAAAYRKRIPFGVISVVALLAVLFYPAQCVYVESRIFFFIFIIMSLLIVDRGVKKGRSAPWISMIVFAVWIAALNITGMLWPVTVVNSGNDVEIKEGVRLVSETANLAGGNEKIELRGAQANSLLLAADGRSVIAAYSGPRLNGVASLPVKGGRPAFFMKLGERGVKLLNIDPDTGDVYAADKKTGVVYELDPDTLKMARRFKLGSEPVSCGYVNSNSSEILAPDAYRLQRRLKVFNMKKLGKPVRELKPGGMADKLFPRRNNPTLPDVWAMNGIFADSANRRYFITYGVSRYLVSMNMDDSAILKVDTDPAPAVFDAAIDTDHNTLFLASPLGGIEYYDTVTLKTGRRLGGMRGTRTVAYDKLRDMIVTADYYGGDVSFIERNSGKTVFRKFVGSRINDIVISPDGKVYLSCARGIYEIDPDRLAAGFKVPSTQ